MFDALKTLQSRSGEICGKGGNSLNGMIYKGKVCCMMLSEGVTHLVTIIKRSINMEKRFRLSKCWWLVRTRTSYPLPIDSVSKPIGRPFKIASEGTQGALPIKLTSL